MILKRAINASVIDFIRLKWAISKNVAKKIAANLFCNFDISNINGYNNNIELNASYKLLDYKDRFRGRMDFIFRNVYKSLALQNKTY